LPRKGRIRIVGKLERYELDKQIDELKELRRQLRREWRDQQQAQDDACIWNADDSD
jgi:hypothetical protein